MLDTPPAIEILLVEDNIADAHIIKLALKKYQVSARLHHVLDGREGLYFLQQQEQYHNVPRPDLILLDLNMPYMNGYEFLTAIKNNEHFKSIPVVVMSTSDVESDVLNSYRLGAASYITKPSSLEQFMSVIHMVTEYWIAIVRLPRRYQYEI